MKNYTPCYKAHKIQDLGVGVMLSGGSCLTPLPVKADIYVGLEQNMSMPKHAMPWNDGQCVSHYIPNMGVPTNTEEFLNMIEWIATQLSDNKSVHVGCIGGHGRTGMVLSALRYVLANDKDATEYIRLNYCQKSVETVVQVEYLHNTFGITKVPPVSKYAQVNNPEYMPPKNKSNNKEIVINHLNIRGTLFDFI